MKKKILFVIPSLDAGGAEKSLINLLSTIDQTRFSVDLFLFFDKGLFLSQVPEFVNILPKNTELEIFQRPLISSVLGFLRKGRLSSAIQRIQFFWTYKKIKNASLAEQYSWKYIRESFGKINTEYDAAIGFLEKSSIYFAVEKVKAKRKIGIIHTYYSNLNIDVEFEKKYFSALDHIAMVSNECSEDLKMLFPEFSEKVMILHNIVSASLIKRLAEKESEMLKPDSIISIGRLVHLKGFDMAIEAAEILKEQHIEFHWYIIGEGPERQNLETMIRDKKLEDYVTLLGLKENPYPYIKQARIFVQPSRYEGKSIAIDEAKILAKPIVLNNFDTAKDQIDNNINGLIAEMNPKSIAENILKYINDPKLTDEIVENLKSGNFGTEHEIDKFYQIIQ